MTKQFKWWMYPLVPLGLLWFLVFCILWYPVLKPAAWAVIVFCNLYDRSTPDWAWEYWR